MLAHCPIHDIDFENQPGGTRFYEHCPECQKEAKAREVSRELERVNENMAAELKAMNIEPEYRHATLGNFYAATSELKKNVEQVQKLIEGKIRELVMIGKNGTGKTHLAVAAVKDFRGKIFSMYEISTRIRSTYTQRAKEDELSVVDELARTPLLVIDEIGRTKGSGAELDWLSYIIDKRHVRNIPTILISNKHLKKNCPEGGCLNCFDNYIGEDVMSRLFEDGLVLHFSGDDYRKKKAGARLAKEHV